MDNARVDYVMNDSGSGDVATRMLENNFDVGALRPWSEKKKKGYPRRSYVTLNKRGKQKVFATNTPASLRIREWIQVDTAVMEAIYTTPQRLFADLRASSTPITIPGGMGKTVLEFEKMSDIGPAITSMDGVRESDSDRPYFDLAGLPLPIVHKDFQFTARQIAVARQGMPLDTSMARLAARKCMEEVEKYTAGSQTYKYAGFNIYGYKNFPQRMTQSITAPSSSNHGTTISEVISMRKKLTDKGYQGPFMVYMSPAWDQYLDEDFSSLKGDNTLRERISKLKGISGVEVSYWLTGNEILMVQLTPDVAQAVVGMDMTTVQWPSKGGMMLNFKVMCILVPRLKADINGITGIVHGS